MSRIGKKPISIPEGVEVTVENRIVTATGPKGTLSLKSHPNAEVSKTDSIITVQRKGNDKISRSVHGLILNLIANMIHGVKEGFNRQLELKGVGFRAQTDGKVLTLSVGYSHPVEIKAPDKVEFKVEKNTLVTVSGIDKQKVGQVAAEIRAVRPPEPYKGKGIRYIDEQVRRKAGKATKAAAK